MPLSYADVGNQIASDLDDSGQKVVSYSWPDFYKMNDAEKIREARMNEIREYLWDEHELLISYGEKAVIVCRDRHINRVRV